MKKIKELLVFVASLVFLPRELLFEAPHFDKSFFWVLVISYAMYITCTLLIKFIASKSDAFTKSVLVTGVIILLFNIFITITFLIQIKETLFRVFTVVSWVAFIILVIAIHKMWMSEYIAGDEKNYIFFKPFRWMKKIILSFLWYCFGYENDDDPRFSEKTRIIVINKVTREYYYPEPKQTAEEKKRYKSTFRRIIVDFFIKVGPYSIVAFIVCFGIFIIIFPRLSENYADNMKLAWACCLFVWILLSIVISVKFGHSTPPNRLHVFANEKNDDRTVYTTGFNWIDKIFNYLPNSEEFQLITEQQTESETGLSITKDHSSIEWCWEIGYRQKNDPGSAIARSRLGPNSAKLFLTAKALSRIDTYTNFNEATYAISHKGEILNPETFEGLEKYGVEIMYAIMKSYDYTKEMRDKLSIENRALVKARTVNLVADELTKGPNPFSAADAREKAILLVAEENYKQYNVSGTGSGTNLQIREN